MDAAPNASYCVAMVLLVIVTFSKYVSNEELLNNMSCQKPLHERFKPMAKCGHKNKILPENILPHSFPNQFLKEIMEMVRTFFNHCQKSQKH